MDKIVPHQVITVLRPKEDVGECIRVVSPYGENMVWVEKYKPLTPLEEKINEVIDFVGGN